ncbi:MAG TPA: hypothetical protein DCS93_26615 [Microscillaceae bacterium]|nr:hypothetical protein [Microscillaceae bacterium]
MKRIFKIHKRTNHKENLAVLEQTLEEGFFEGEHLNDAGIGLFVEAKLVNRQADLPAKIRDHVEECAICQREVYEFYQFMQDENVSNSSVHTFLDNYQQTLSPKQTPVLALSRRVRSIAAAVIILFVVGWVMFNIPTGKKVSPISQIHSPFVNQSIDVRYNELEINNEEAKTLRLENGTTIHIPAYSFIDKDGRPVKGKVKLNYREMHSAADVIASGVPMEYDSAGVKNNLETAGMFEIRGKKGKEPVYIAQGKTIDVQFASRHEGEGFNHYYLEDGTQPLTYNYLNANQAGIIPGAFGQSNTPARVNPRWNWMGMSLITSKLLVQKPEPVQKNSQNKANQRIDSLKNVINQMKAQHRTDSIEFIEKMLMEQKKKQEQVRKAKEDYFQLDFNVGKNPYLEYFKEVVWQYVGENKQQSPTQGNSWIFNEKWDDIKLTNLRYVPLSLKGHQGEVFSVSFSPDSKYLVSASADGTAKIWDNRGNLLRSLDGHSQAVTQAKFSSNGKYIITASNDKTARLWSLDGKVLANLTGHQGKIISVDFSENGQRILTASEDNTVKLWSTSGRLLHTLAHKYALKSALFAPNSKYVLTVSKKGPAKIWYIDGKLLHTFEGDYNSASFSRDSEYLLTTSTIAEFGTKLWRINGELMHTIKGATDQAIFSNDGNYLITVGNRSAHLFSIYKKGVRTVLIKNMGGSYKGKGHLGKINNIQFSPSQHSIITASTDNLAKIWDGNGNFRYNLRGHLSKVNDAAFSPNGLHIATASADKTVKLWIETSQKDIYELELVKERKVIETKRGRKEVPGKNFVTIVRKANNEEIPEELQAEGILHKSFTQSKNLNEVIAKYEEAVKQKSNLLRTLKAKKPEVKAKVLRGFKIRKFGVYGVHRIFKMPDNIICKAEFDFGNGQTSLDENYRVYLITGDRGSAIIPYTQQSWQKFQFSPDMVNKLIAILPNDRLGMMNKQEFAHIDIDKLDKQGKYTFRLHPRPIMSKQDLDFVLN